MFGLLSPDVFPSTISLQGTNEGGDSSEIIIIVAAAHHKCRDWMCSEAARKPNWFHLVPKDAKDIMISSYISYIMNSN